MVKKFTKNMVNKIISKMINNLMDLIDYLILPRATLELKRLNKIHEKFNTDVENKACNKEEIIIKSKIYYIANKKRLSEYNKLYIIKNREKLNKSKKIYRDKIKKEVIAYYSNNSFKCLCCKEKNYEFLTIDHIDGGGAKHRKEMKSSNIYLELKKNKYPTGYRVLCFNCNISFGLFGYCPHNNK